jgi:hypothetical protein
MERAFPRLEGEGWTKTSHHTPEYNCIAWAAGDDERWWWPSPESYWPPGVSEDGSLECFVAAFRTRGYERCADAVLEPGFEKVALYADDAGQPTHAARQLPSGRWTSKLGTEMDIEHTLAGLEGPVYGRVALFLRRPSF